MQVDTLTKVNELNLIVISFSYLLLTDILFDFEFRVFLAIYSEVTGIQVLSHWNQELVSWLKGC